MGWSFCRWRAPHRVATFLVANTIEIGARCMTEIFSWGYIGWLTRRTEGYELSGYLDGELFSVIAVTPKQATRMFSRAARRAYLRRQTRVLRGLPARKAEPLSSADVHYEVAFGMVAVGLIRAATRRILTRLRKPKS